MENNYYLLGMHAVFKGNDNCINNAGGGEASLPSEGV